MTREESFIDWCDGNEFEGQEKAAYFYAWNRQQEKIDQLEELIGLREQQITQLKHDQALLKERADLFRMKAVAYDRLATSLKQLVETENL